MSEQTQAPGTEAATIVIDVLLPLDAPAPADPTASAEPGDAVPDPIAAARERVQQATIEQLQRRVEALEAAAAAEPVTAPSPLQ